MTTTHHHLHRQNQHDHVLAGRTERRRGRRGAEPAPERGRRPASVRTARTRERVTADAVTSAYVNEIARSGEPPAALSAAAPPGAPRRLECV
jgi:hypothetical protein